MSENKQLDRVKEITDQLEAGIHDLFESERYQQWLTTMSRFHNYSLNNTMLIAMQKPEATLVAGYTAWQKRNQDPGSCSLQGNGGDGQDRSGYKTACPG